MAEASVSKKRKQGRTMLHWFALDQGWSTETLGRLFVALGIAVGTPTAALAQQSTFQLPPTSLTGSAPRPFPSQIPTTPMPAPSASVYTPVRHENNESSDRLVTVGRELETLPDLEVGRMRLLQVRKPVAQVQVADPNIVECRPLDSHRREWSLRGLQSGTTVINVVFGDGSSPERQDVLSYQIHIGGRELNPERLSQARYDNQSTPSAAYPMPSRRVNGPELAGEEPQVIEIQVPRAPGYVPRPMNQVPSQALTRPSVESQPYGYSQGGSPVGRPGEFAPAATYVQSTGAQPPAIGTQPPLQKGPPLKDVTEEPLPPSLAMPRRLEQNPCLEGPPGPRSTGVATPSAETVQRYRQLVTGTVGPEMAQEIIQGRTLILQFSDPPIRISVGDEKVLQYTPVGDVPRQLILQAIAPGSTTLTLWFGDAADPAKQPILSYLISVLPEPGARSRLERVYKQLQEEINQAFPDDYVRLFLVGDKLVVSGQAKDAVEATKILQVIRAAVPANPADRAAQSRNPAANLPLNLATGLPFDPFGRGNPSLEDYIVQGESNIIDLLKIPGEQQVALKVTVAEISRTAARSMGINFSITNAAGQTVFAQNTGNLTGTAGAANTTAGNVANLPILLDGGRISLLIQALRRVDLARSLAETTVATLNGHEANFLAGGQFPVPVVTGNTTTGQLSGVNFVPFGVQLSFTPYITDKDRIRLTLTATVSTRDVATGATINGANVPGLTARNISTTVEMREGQTMAIGGLMQTNFGADTTRVPGLGDIPFGGQFFRSDHTSAGESELVLLVTPELIHPMEPNEIPPMPGSDTFEPGDLNFYLRGKLENTRSYDYRSPVMHDIERMRAYHNCEIIYMLGPTGYTEGH